MELTLKQLNELPEDSYLLIDIRDGGDVEFTAKFYEGNEEVTMAALEEAVRNYLEDDAGAAK